MTDEHEPTCCDLACYEDEGCTCDGCFRDLLGRYATTITGHFHDSSLRCRICMALYRLTRYIGRLADKIDPP